MTIILETPRLVLREMTLDDLDFVAAMLADGEVMRYYPRCYTRDEAKAWIERQRKRYARHGHGLWMAVEKSEERPVGQVGLLIQNVQGVEEKEIACLIHRPYWRQGLATEAAMACRDHAFDVFGRPRVIALIRPEHLASQGMVRKLGMAPLPDRIWHSGLEHLVFSVSRPKADPFSM